ncbi:MAG: peptidoglycan DD-metalloendopeptidase family protein [Rhodobacteraceae bacterium]|nr:peptidoglycan DD-metalloendopeptidase family protein [Paracoccaceae bacterium]
MPIPTKLKMRGALLLTALTTLAACEGGIDFDLRHLADGFTTTQAVTERVSAERPEPDTRGIISYPAYQVALARRGDTVTKLAARIGLPVEELARFNGLPVDAPLRKDELVALPRRVSEPPSGPIAPGKDSIDITTLAGDAIDRADSNAGTVRATTTQPSGQTGEEPTRHQVERGETAYSIARAYNVSVRSLADWNGLGSSLTVREGQYLLIPVAAPQQPEPPATSVPGQGTATPTPPSASTALPSETTTPGQGTNVPVSPDLGAAATAASAAAMMLPVEGRITRAFKRGTTDGIDISASAGTAVKAAAAGTVAAITRDTEQVPILVIRHPNNVLTVYANITDISVKKGDRVTRGQKVAEVREGDPAFLHFQVREGTLSVDPATYLN